MGYFFLRHKFSIKVNKAFDDISTPDSCQKFHSCCTIYILFIACKYIKTLHPIWLLILEVLNHNCLLDINLLFQLDTCVPKFNEAVLTSSDYHYSLKVVAEGVSDFDAIYGSSRMRLLLQDEILRTTIRRNITQTVAKDHVRLNRVTKAIGYKIHT